MSELPTDLDTLLEAVEVMMGARFAEHLQGEMVGLYYHAIDSDRRQWAGRDRPS